MYKIVSNNCIKDCVINKTKHIGIIAVIALAFSSGMVSAAAPKITISVNRFVVLDDPNAGIKAPGFFDPTDVTGGSFNTDYWKGESTTIRGAAVVFDGNGSLQPGITINFKLKNPGGVIKSTSSSTTDSKGTAYFSYNLNEQRYWGYWTLEGNASVSGTNTSSNASFVLYWWGCSQCHGSEDPGSKYIPKSYYTKGYTFHQEATEKHAEAMSKGNCIICHQMYNGTPINWKFRGDTPALYTENEYSPDWHNGKAKCQDCHVNSNNAGRKPEIAGCYDTAGCHPKKNTNLSKVNSTTGYAVGGNYRTNYSFIPNNTSKAHTSSGVACISCHNAGHKITKPYNTNATSNSYTENEQCWSCHTDRLTTHYQSSNCVSCHSQDAHNVTGGGGPDCISCHDAGKSAQHRINNTDIDKGVHANINSNAIVGPGISPENKKCWACHQSGGTQPTGMGDIFKNPRKCFDCHGPNKPYAGVSSAPTVSNHFKSGTNITAHGEATDNSSSCIACHNTNEMKVPYTEDNTFGTNYSWASHYDKKRTDLISLTQTAYCTYCHNSTTENVVFGVSDFNNSIANHSNRITSPQCGNCHDTIKENIGRIHNSTLSKPVSNDILCKNCHGPSGSASTNNKVEHKNLYCTECHAKGAIGSLAGKDIHGIKYLTQSNTYSTANTSAVNCITCHLTTTVDSSLPGFSAFKINNGKALHHSDNVLNGTVFGNYWAPGSVGSCIYCHNDTKHSATPLGRPLQWLGSSYQLYGLIGTNSTCASCHYKESGGYVTMQSTFTSARLPIPPEITNGSWNRVQGYFNHSLTSYLDQDCKLCHGSLLSAGANMSEFVHNVGQGSCVACHTADPTSRYYVNISKFSLHADLDNASDGPGVVSDSDCLTCHFGASNIPMIFGQGLGVANRSNTYFCEDCHTTAGNGPVKPNLLTQTALYINTLSHGKTDCKWCHIAGDSLSRPLTNVSGMDERYHAGGPTGTANGTTCTTCHYKNLQDLSFHAPGVMANGPYAHQSPAYCTVGCHTNNNVHVVNYYNTSISPPTVTGSPNVSVITTSNGKIVMVNATVTTIIPSDIFLSQMQIGAAQFKVTDASGGIVIDWSNINATDGNFDSNIEAVNATISGLASGNYNVYVRGMAAAPKTNLNLPYYPLNGYFSLPASRAFTI